MKLVFLSLFCFVLGSVNATNYYVSRAGNDANNGTSTLTPWLSIAKVNSFGAAGGFVSGDIIHFRCGDGFYGSIAVKQNGLTFKSYGTGAKPLISGLTQFKKVWTNVGNVYTFNVPNATADLLVVYLDGIPMEMGRYPNSSAANGGYLNYESFSGATNIVDNNPGISAPGDWGEAEICVRKNNWTLERNKMVSLDQDLGTGALTYDFIQGGTINPVGIAGLQTPSGNGYGYFIQNALSTLDTHGEWYFNPVSKMLSMYLASSPVNYVIQAATQNVLLDIADYDNTTIQDLVFIGANKNAIASNGYVLNGPITCSTVVINNCNFTNIGARAINLFRTNNATVQNCTFDWCLSTAVQIGYPSPGFAADNANVTNCTFDHIAPYNGMGCFFDAGDFTGISCTNNNSLIQYNNIQNTGKGGIFWQGSNVTISKNFLNNTVKHLNDYGAIYTYATNSYTSLINRTIENNIVLNTLGQPYGSNSPTVRCAGIYLDGRTMAVTVTNNTVAYSGRNGIHCNNPYAVTLSGNTLFDNSRGISFMRWKGSVATSLNIGITQMQINATDNISYSRNPAHYSLFYTNGGLLETPSETYPTCLNSAGIGTFNNNYYGHVNQVPFKMELYNNYGGAEIQTSPMSLEGWSALSTQDAASSRINQMQTYTTSNPGTNLFSNGTFNSNINGITTYSAASSWDGNSVFGPGNVGSLKSVATNNPNTYSLLFSNSAITLVPGKSYMLSFRTKGSAVNNSLKASLRRGTGALSSDALLITEKQLHSYNSGDMYHEFVFITPTSPDGSTRFAIELERNNATTYIDDIQFKTVDAVSVTPDVRFEYNATQSPVTLTLGNNYKDARNVNYLGSITLQPYTSAVLFRTSQQLAFRPMPVTAVPAPVVKETAGLKVSCFPNPATSELTIAGLEAKDEWQSAEIISLEGKRTGLFLNVGAKATLAVDLKQLLPGKYFVVLTNKAAKTKVLSFIKQ